MRLRFPATLLAAALALPSWAGAQAAHADTSYSAADSAAVEAVRLALRQGPSQENARIARRLAQQALTRFTAAGSVRGQYEAYRVLGWLMSNAELWGAKYGPDSALFFARRALELARRLDASTTREAQRALASGMGEAGMRDSAIALLRQVAQEARAAHDSAGLVRARVDFAFAADTIHPAEARAAAAEALALARPLGGSLLDDALTTGQHMEELAEKQARAAHDTVALVAALRAHAALRREGTTMWAAPWAVDTLLAQVLLARRDTAGAVTELRRDLGDPRTELKALLPILAAIERAVGPADSVIAHLRLFASTNPGSARAAQALIEASQLATVPDSANALLVDAAMEAETAGDHPDAWLAYTRLAERFASRPAAADSAWLYARLALGAYAATIDNMAYSPVPAAHPASAALRDCRAWGQLLGRTWLAARAAPGVDRDRALVTLALALEMLPDSVRPSAPPLPELRRDAMLAGARLGAARDSTDDDADEIARAIVVLRDRWLRGGALPPLSLPLLRPRSRADSVARCVNLRPDELDDRITMIEGADDARAKGDTVTLALAIAHDSLVIVASRQYGQPYIGLRALTAADRALLAAHTDLAGVATLLLPAAALESFGNGKVLVIAAPADLAPIPFGSLPAGDGKTLGERLQVRVRPPA